MDFDQILFKKFIDIYQRLKNGRSSEKLEQEINLKDLTSRLTILARAITGSNIDIVSAEEEGGWRNNQFFLPKSFSHFPSIEDNLNFYLYRVVFLSIQRDLNLNWQDSEKRGNELSRTMAKEASQKILLEMESDYTPIYEYYLRIKDSFKLEQDVDFWLYGKYMRNKAVKEAKDEIDNASSSSQAKDSVKAKTEIKSKVVEDVEILNVDKKKQEDYMLTHNFEKVETAEEFSGVWRGFDGEDTLEDDQDALNDINLGHLVRTDEVAESIYQADFRDLAHIAESANADSEEHHVLYDEWNYKKQSYKPEYCKVFIKKQEKGSLDYADKCLSENKKVLDNIRRKFAQINQVRNKVNRLPQGENLDTDALLDWHIDLESGRTPSENIYFSKRKKESNLAILFLVDLSLSTDSYVDGSRVLDVEKQATILIGEVLSEYNVAFAIGGFYSKTRNHCAYVPIKGFDQSWPIGKRAIDTVRPEGYTRIGPALRHAKSIVEKSSAENKWVILLSDGKPNDYDKYEGKYGVQDVKQALREMHEKHINTYAIAIESTARYYLPQMFGHNHYNILSHPNMLSDSLANLFKRIQQV